MRLTLLFVILLVCSGQNAFGQEEEWKAYLADYDNGPGAVTLRMDLVKAAPLTAYPFVLITGVTFPSSRKDGFPESSTFKLLYQVNDEIAEYLTGMTEHIFVGTFTHQYERLQYFYLKSDRGVKDRLTQFYEERYPDHKFYIKLQQDAQWTSYLDFLYPEEAILKAMKND